MAAIANDSELKGRGQERLVVLHFAVVGRVQERIATLPVALTVRIDFEQKKKQRKKEK
jgi:hypothetical protein